jgi:hypothetical protein
MAGPTTHCELDSPITLWATLATGSNSDVQHSFTVPSSVTRVR